MARPDVLIIGGGITGLAAAYEIARAGARVELLEARRLGAMASTWTLGGVRQSGRHPAELPLAIAAVRRWQGLTAELDAATGYRQRGNLRLARTEDEVAAIARLVADQRALGLTLDFLPGNAAIRAVAPAIGPAVLAASFCPGDGHADPDATIAAYAAAARRHGAVISEGVMALGLLREGARITGVATPTGPRRADRIVVAGGVHAPELLASADITLPFSVKRVTVLQTIAAAPSFEPVFGVANADCAGRQEIGGRFRVTTGIGDWPGDVAGWTEAALRPSLGVVSGLISRATRILPGLGDVGVERVWGGLIDLTSDALPVLDAPETHPGLIIAAGFSGHGFGIGPVSGVILRALAVGEDSGFDLRPFRLARFDAAPAFAPLTLHG